MANIYTGAMGMISFENKLNTVGNNIANSLTNGYKRDTDTMRVFEESFMRKISNSGDQRIGNYQHQVQTDGVHTNFEQGFVKVTNGSLDFAINDSVRGNDGSVSFFSVESNGQELLTRDGHFKVDVEGYLNNASGDFLLDSSGNRINVLGVSGVAVNENGIISNASTGQYIATMQIRTVPEDQLGNLNKVGVNNYLADNINFGAGEYVIHQGILESSNVDQQKEMTDLMVAQKGFTMSSKALSVMDRINEIDSNILGK